MRKFVDDAAGNCEHSINAVCICIFNEVCGRGAVEFVVGQVAMGINPHDPSPSGLLLRFFFDDAGEYALRGVDCRARLERVDRIEEFEGAVFERD